MRRQCKDLSFSRFHDFAKIREFVRRHPSSSSSFRQFPTDCTIWQVAEINVFWRYVKGYYTFWMILRTPNRPIISWMREARDGDLSNSRRRAIFECFSLKAFSMSSIFPKPCLTSVMGILKVEINIFDANWDNSVWERFFLKSRVNLNNLCFYAFSSHSNSNVSVARKKWRKLAWVQVWKRSIFEREKTTPNFE